ncbi:nucleoside deaminase [Candidatus Dependentiae bacterium]|nr:nucleoside deaminase [Candidatus Dependentiae bacterium]MBU4387148.1 nucleoside deaminase [Candidatus Dependentiae bacterium]MCG2756734.1 nucleoside deaminase [Candidatus Dependentiae bacterium]
MYTKENLIFMNQALNQAKLALKKEEVPVGAVIVDDMGNILSKAYNKTEKNKCQTGHAEVLAIQKACKKLKTWRLDNCSIYVSLEPCLMCLGLIQLSRINALYFGAISKEFGSGLQDALKHKLYKKDLLIVGGLKENESIDILRKFFMNLRKLRKVNCERKSRILRKGKKEIA